MKYQTYKLLWPTNDYIYVGSTQDLEKRFRCHRSRSLTNSKKTNPKMSAVWHKHGDPWMIPVATFDTVEEMLLHEQVLIDTWFGKKECLNINPRADRPPGNKGLERSAEWMAKIATANSTQIVAIDPQGNETLYQSMNECARQLGFTVSTICKFIRLGGKASKGTSKGWSFRKVM